MNRTPHESVLGMFLLWTVAAFSLSKTSAAPIAGAGPFPTGSALQTAFGHDGLMSLKSGKDELLSGGQIAVQKAIFTRPDGTASGRSLGSGTQAVDLQGRRVTRVYSWGAVSCTYAPRPGRLDLDIAITNRSPDVLSGILVQALALKFPGGSPAFENDLRVGVCLRPQKPMKSLYGDVAEQVQVADDVYNLNDKIAYAKKRWGCTLFYVDSNVHFEPGSSPSDGDAYELLPAKLFQDVATANPDVLLIPEQQTTRYYAYAPPYDELRQGVAATPEAVRRVYPGAFTVISVATDTSGGPLDTRRAELIDSVRRGDILLFRAWYETPEMKPVQEIYRAANR